MDIKKRFDRILSVFIHLQSKPIVTAQELADVLMLVYELYIETLDP